MQTPWKIKSLPFIDVSNPICCLEKSDSKFYLTALFALHKSLLLYYHSLNSLLALYHYL